MEFNDVRREAVELSKEIEAAVASVLASGRYILGPQGELFENEFARYCGVARGVGVASGTDAIRIALEAIGVSRDDEVLVPAVSAAATAMAVAQIGAVPVFVDVSLHDFNMDPEMAVDRRTSRTKAIVPVHLYGMPARLKALAAAGAPMIEDAAQAHGSSGPWGRCGAYGRAAAFSFYPTKNLGGYGDGGMLVTSDAEIAERARLLRNYGQRENYASDILGGNSRLDEIQAAILRLKLRRLDAQNHRRGQIAALYREAFQTLPLKMQEETGKSNCHLFVILVRERDALRRHLASEGVPTLVHYPIPLSRQAAFAEFSPAHCPNADKLCSRVLSLPMSPSLTDGEAMRVIDAVIRFFTTSGLSSHADRGEP
ncbi:MAG TPA: DegT/DnrJ/EryC1/StrS family aminotransferase [Terriglobia bacterium]|nr:DegT/DnrJ/EryC1/StrS family aminotransferase [Terriglobia bacterium]